MKIFNKGEGAIQFKGGTINPKGVATVSTDVGEKLKALYPKRIVDLENASSEANDAATSNQKPQPIVGPTTGAGEPLTPEEEAKIAEDSAAAEKLRQEALKKPAKANDDNTSSVKISPAAKEYAEANGIDITTLKGTGLNGLINKADVDKAIDEKDPKKD